MVKIDLEDGKYNIYIGENNLIEKIDRYDYDWIEKGMIWDIRGMNCWHALLWDFLELKEENKQLKEQLETIRKRDHYD